MTAANITANKRTDIKTEEFRKVLLEMKGRLSGVSVNQRTGNLEEAEDATNESAYSSTDLSENGDSAAILADLERDAPAAQNTTEILAEIDKALDRIAAGVFGIDTVTGEAIPIERLRALPWAANTVETAERIQR